MYRGPGSGAGTVCNDRESECHSVSARRPLAATLVAFAATLEAGAQDDALDLLDILITEIFSDATKAGEQARLRTVKDLDAAAMQLGQACRSLKLGVVQATSIMKALRIDDRPTKLAQAVAELGRIDKTIHALNYTTKTSAGGLSSNSTEERNAIGWRERSHGKRGELRQRYREGQEDQLGALGLVVNVIVLWNTLYINATLEQLQSEGFRSKQRMSRGFHRWCLNTLIYLGDMRSRFRIRCKEESCGHCGARRTPSTMLLEELIPVFCSVASQHPRKRLSRPEEKTPFCSLHCSLT